MPPRFFSRTKKNSIVIVSGLPRSGTSMMMSMLEAGGLQLITDNYRLADDNNPNGYFEFERVKKLKDGDIEWVKDARGKAVKVISALLKYLPMNFEYQIIFMKRNMDEILRSQRRMLERDGKVDDDVSDIKLANLFKTHLYEVKSWLASQKNISVLEIGYNDILTTPESKIALIDEFLVRDLDKNAMRKVIEPRLYRERQ